jgi:hypothetical protein
MFVGFPAHDNLLAFSRCFQINPSAWDYIKRIRPEYIGVKECRLPPVVIVKLNSQVRRYQ